MKLISLLSLILFLLVACSGLHREPAGKYDAYEVKESFSLPPATQRLMHFEQKSINRSVDTDKIVAPDIAAQDLLFRPENQKWFVLKTYWIPQDELKIADYTSRPMKELLTKTVDDKLFYRLIVHPESEKFYEDFTSQFERAEDMYGSSTSSSRTVLIRSQEGVVFFGKLSLNVELGGVVRTIPKGEVARSVGTTMVLDQLQKKPQVNNTFKYVRESLGIIPENFERGGMIIREIPKLPANHALLPLFAIYADNDGTGSLLKKWIAQAKKENTDPVDWIRKKLLTPFAQGWAHAYLEQKIVMEAHAQNVLVEVDRDNLPTGKFYHRDFGGFNIELEHYKSASWFKALPVFTDMATDYHQKFHETAIVDSLHTYFEGGFLFNMTNEYEEITDSDVDFGLEFRKILAEIIKEKTNVELKPANGKRFYKNISKINEKILELKNPPGLCKKIMDLFF